MNPDPGAMREPVIDIESAAAKREAASPGRPVLVPMLRADPDLNLTALPEERENRPAPAILPNEPLLNLTPVPAQPPVLPGRSWQPPVIGSLAVIFGIAALFKATLLLAPLALVFALLAALFRQFSWAAIGGISGLVALATSPWFWGIVGMTWLVDAVAGYFGFGGWYTSFF
jgi:hypothetical protein